jgi:hypothetical protein
VYKRQLSQRGIRHVLIGGLAVGCHAGRTRATRDVDVIVDPTADVMPAAKAIAKHCRGARVRRKPSFISISQRGVLGEEEIVDLITSSAGSYGLAFDATVSIELDGQSIALPTPELLIALTYIASLNPIRPPPRREQDRADMAAIAAANPKLSVSACVIFADRVQPGFGEALRHHLRDLV